MEKNIRKNQSKKQSRVVADAELVNADEPAKDYESTSDELFVDSDEETASYAQIVEPGEDRHVHEKEESAEQTPTITSKETVNIDDESYVVVEGDLLLDQDQYDLYQEQQEIKYAYRNLVNSLNNTNDTYALLDQTVTPGGHGSSALITIGKNGKIIRWAPGVVLTFCVLEKTFPTKKFYEVVANHIAEAAQDWMDVCGVEFRYVSELDSSSSLRPEGVVFPVRYLDAQGQFIAAAFFPTDMKSRWRVLIDPSYMNTSFDKTGVLRHELGHCLGYRHEHITSGAPPECPDESTNNTIPITDYDPQSVMHYFCGNVGSKNLEITQIDITGSQIVYGPPLGEFILLEP